MVRPGARLPAAFRPFPGRPGLPIGPARCKATVSTAVACLTALMGGGCLDHIPVTGGRTLSHRYRGVSDDDLTVTPRSGGADEPQALRRPPHGQRCRRRLRYRRLPAPTVPTAPAPEARAADPGRHRTRLPDHAAPTSSGAVTRPSPPPPPPPPPPPAPTPRTTRSASRASRRRSSTCSARWTASPPPGPARPARPGSSSTPSPTRAPTPTSAWTRPASGCLYSSTRHSEHSDIYMQRVDGTSVIQLTSETAAAAYPCFSPDGKQIAFASTRSGPGRSTSWTPTAGTSCR